MKSTDIPLYFPKPFADAAGSGYIRSIPTASQIGITDGAWSLTDGSVPLNFVPNASGGVASSGQDFNGLMKWITQVNQWFQAGGLSVYDATFSTAIGGYPNGAVLLAADGGGFWQSTADDNTTDPDTGGAGWVRLGMSKPVATGFSRVGPHYCRVIDRSYTSMPTSAFTVSAPSGAVNPTALEILLTLQTTTSGETASVQAYNDAALHNYGDNALINGSALLMEGFKLTVPLASGVAHLVPNFSGSASGSYAVVGYYD